jgi:hypothetical protein
MSARRNSLTCAGALLCLFDAAPVLALDWGLDTRLGAVHSDNVGQTTEPLADGASIGTLEVHGIAAHGSRTLQMDVEANHAYRHFLDDRYDGESQSQLRSSLDWMPLGEVLTLSAADTYGQLALNPAEGLLPSQYENANVFTAGPTLSLPLGADMRFVSSGEYRRATFEDSPIDTERKFGQLALERNLSRLYTMHVAASTARVDFASEGATRGYDVHSAEVGVDAVGRRTTLTLSGGIDHLKSAGETFDGTQFQLGFSRELTRSSHFSLTLRREITDAADVFSLGQISDPALTNIRDVQVTAQPLLRTQYRTGWTWTGNRVDVTLQAGYTREQFRDLPQDPLLSSGQDRTIREYGATTAYRFRGGSSISLGAEVLQERFVSGVTSDDLLTTATFLQQLTDKLGLELRLQRIERSNSPLNFDELRAFAFLRYVFRESREAQAPIFDRALERRGERARGDASRRDPADD